MDHLRLALDPQNQTLELNDLHKIELLNEALPEFDFDEVNTSSYFQQQKLSAPLLISSMTAGHEFAREINRLLFQISERFQILLGVGSQRRDLDKDQKTLAGEWAVREEFPGALVLANIGIAQLIEHGAARAYELVSSLRAVGIFVHVNALQECLQPEGTPRFRGAIKCLAQLVEISKVPVVIKEVGCGINVKTIQRLQQECGISYFDLSGAGGTHWGRIEGGRSNKDQILYSAAESFRSWGQSLSFCLEHATRAELKAHLWASGGVRSGLDVAKLIAMGAEIVGLAKPWLEAMIEMTSAGEIKIKDKAEKNLENLYARLRLELAIAMFCSGCKDLKELGRARWMRRA